MHSGTNIWTSSIVVESFVPNGIWIWENPVVVRVVIRGEHSVIVLLINIGGYLCLQLPLYDLMKTKQGN